MLNLHKYTSHSIGEKKRVNEHIMQRLDNIESLQRTIVLKLYEMDIEGPKMVLLSSEEPPNSRESSKHSMENDEKFIFEPP